MKTDKKLNEIDKHFICMNYEPVIFRVGTKIFGNR